MNSIKTERKERRNPRAKANWFSALTFWYNFRIYIINHSLRSIGGWPELNETNFLSFLRGMNFSLKKYKVF